MNNFTVGGVERLLLDLSTELQKTHDILVVTLVGGGPLQQDFQKSVDVRQLGPSLGEYHRGFIQKIIWLLCLPYTFLQLLILLRKVKAKSVISSLYHADILGILAAYLLSVPQRIVIQHDRYRFGRFRKWMRKHIAFNLSTGVIAVSRDVSSFLQEYWDIAQSKITLIPNGIDAGLFIPREYRPENPPVLGIIGRLERVKGHKILFESLVALKNQYGYTPSVMIAGTGSCHLEYEQYVDQHELKHVHFLGYVNPPDFFDMVDVCLVPSQEEGFGLVLVEALFAAKMVIASDLPVFREIAGLDYLHYINTVQDCTDVLRHVMEDYHRVSEYQKKAHLWIKNHGNEFTLETMAHAYRRLF